MPHSNGKGRAASQNHGRVNADDNESMKSKVVNAHDESMECKIVNAEGFTS